MIKPITKRIVTSATTTVIAQSCSLRQLVISCVNAGTTWTLQIQDKAGSPNVLIPAFDLLVPVDGRPNVDIKWEEYPIPMSGGIDIITAGGSPGEVMVSMTIQKSG